MCSTYQPIALLGGGWGGLVCSGDGGELYLFLYLSFSPLNCLIDRLFMFNDYPRRLLMAMFVMCMYRIKSMSCLSFCRIC